MWMVMSYVKESTVSVVCADSTVYVSRDLSIEGSISNYTLSKAVYFNVITSSERITTYVQNMEGVEWIQGAEKGERENKFIFLPY